MNYLFYRRLRGPVFLLTFGVTAALAQWDVLSFSRSWPLYLIVYGVLRLAEGAALAGSPQMPVYPAGNYQAYAATNYAGRGYQAAPAAPGTGLATVSPATIQTTPTTPTASSIEKES